MSGVNNIFGDFFSTREPEEKRTDNSYSSAAESLRQIESMDRKMAQQMQTQLEELKKMTSEMDLKRIDDEVARDFNLNTAPKVAVAEDENAKKPTVGAEGFDGILPELTSQIFGQEEFLQQLVIAFKRPFIAGYPENGARNTVFIHGKSGTGRHSSVNLLTKLLDKKGVFLSSEVRVMDLSLYPTQAEEKVFLQDLYMNLSSPGYVIVFDKYQFCHTSILIQLSDLVVKGQIHLNTRYISSKGRLVDAGNALTSDTVGVITPKGKYLIFISESDNVKLASTFGAAFVSAISDKCSTASFTEDSYKKIAEAAIGDFKKTSLERLDFTINHDDAFTDYVASKHGADSNAQGIREYCQGIFLALAQYKLERDTKKCDMRLFIENERIMADAGTGAFDLFALLPGEYKGELDAVRLEMNNVVGLAPVKDYILSLESHYRVQQMRKDQGMLSSGVSMHMIFTGNPGTGKTTIARLVSKQLKAIGVLSGGQLIEVSRADLVGKYVGHTAPLTSKVIKSAIGGVLFIDEAYSLWRGDQDSFGLEAIDTLVKGMEDNRDNLIVILAGYSKEMAEFMESNSGLRSRFPNIIEFPDYTGEELLDIAVLQAKAKGYEVEDAAKAAMLDYFTIIQAMSARDSGNGRLARNVIERAILDQSKRIVVKDDALNILRRCDFDLFENPDVTSELEDE